jgi:hypothetical protein
MSDARDYNFSFMASKPRLLCFELAYKKLFLTYLLPICHWALGMPCTRLTHMLGPLHSASLFEPHSSQWIMAHALISTGRLGFQHYLAWAVASFVVPLAHSIGYATDCIHPKCTHHIFASKWTPPPHLSRPSWMANAPLWLKPSHFVPYCKT